MTTPMTNQQVFDTVVTHLAKQGRRAMRDGVCAYRSDDGTLRCAVGCLIPDELYNRQIERRNVYGIWYYIRDMFKGPDALALLRHLQLVHDEVESWNPKEMSKALRNVAIQHELDDSIVGRTDFSHVHP